MQSQGMETSYEEYDSNMGYQQSYQYSEKECNFCNNIDILRCMMISVVHKHNQEPNYYSNIVEKLIFKKDSPLYSKYEELLKNVDISEKMTCFYGYEIQQIELQQHLQYYKFRKFVPLFANNYEGNIMHSYYYERLKVYYNEVKKKLNITIDPSSQTEKSEQYQHTLSNFLFKSKILNDLTEDFKTGQKSIQNYKSQSKALEDLVSILKSNEKFKFIKSLNEESQWQKLKKTSKQMFKDHIYEKRKNYSQINSKSNNKIFIKFYSKGFSNKIKSQSTQNLKSQKLPKNKDLRLFDSDKDRRIIQKIEKIKQQILGQKMNSKTIKQHVKKKDIFKKIKLQSSDKIHINKKQDFLTIKPTTTFQGNILKETSIKGLKPHQLQKELSSRKSLSKLIVKNSSIQVKQHHAKKVEISKSDSKLKQNKSTKSKKQIRILQRQDSPIFMSTRKLSIDRKQRKAKFKDASQQSNQKLKSQRKSLDLSKMKALLLIENLQLKPQISKKQDILTQRYRKISFDQQPKLEIRTTNVSPNTERKRIRVTDEIHLEKSDNIVSIKKKKLEMLKKKLEVQKMGKM